MAAVVVSVEVRVTVTVVAAEAKQQMIKTDGVAVAVQRYREEQNAPQSRSPEASAA